MAGTGRDGMRAAVYHGRRDVRVERVADPAAPGEGEVILRVRRAAICGTDASEWADGPHVTANMPVVIGHEFVGDVVARGPGVSLRIGERVVSGAGVSCGACAWCRRGRTNLCESYRTLGQQVDGGLAELVATPATICRRVPEACSDDSAAMAQPLAVALHAARRGAIAPGSTVLIIGVGGIGAFLVPAVRAQTAGMIIAADIDEARLATARALGADTLVNAGDGGLVPAVMEATDGSGAEVVIEASGAPGTAEAAIAATARGGRTVMVGLPAVAPAIDLVQMVVREVDVVSSAAHVCDLDLPEALGVLAVRQLDDLLVDRVIGLDDVVDAGICALCDGSAHGKVIVDPTRP